MHQIITRRFNNAIQAIKFLDNITLNHIHPNKSGIVKKSKFDDAIKKKYPLLKQRH